MATTGLPVPREDFAVAAALWALNIREKIQNFTTQCGVKMKFRVGIDTGPVVAGVIGKKKFIYDLWGDAVNTASRMADFGISGEVQVTERFTEALNDYYQKNRQLTGENIFCYEERAEIEIKGKGMMKTFILKNKN